MSLEEKYAGLIVTKEFVLWALPSACSGFRVFNYRFPNGIELDISLDEAERRGICLTWIGDLIVHLNIQRFVPLPDLRILDICPCRTCVTELSSLKEMRDEQHRRFENAKIIIGDGILRFRECNQVT